MTRVAVNPALIRWARERAGHAQEALAAKFKKLPEWEVGETQPTLKQGLCCKVRLVGDLSA